MHRHAHMHKDEQIYMSCLHMLVTQTYPHAGGHAPGLTKTPTCLPWEDKELEMKLGEIY